MPTHPIKAIVILVFAMLPASPSSAQDIGSGNYWMKICTNDPPDLYMCATFVFAVNEFNELLPSMGHLRAFCPPRGATGGQLVAVVVKHLKDHPSDLHQPFIKLAVAALKEAWPCPSKAN